MSALRFPIVMLLCVVNLAMGSAEDACRLIPEATLRLPNLLTRNWRIGEVEYSKERAENFEFTQENTSSNSKVILIIKALTNKHAGYWSTQVHLKGGHKYLAYFRALNRNGNLLLWMYGSYGDNKQLDERIQISSSAASYLIPLYLSPKYTTERMGANWHALYRTFTVPNAAKELELCFAIGSFYGEGTIKYTDITLVDVTQEKQLPLQADISVPNKHIKSVRIYLQRTEGDIIFEKQFSPGVASYREVIPGTSEENAYGMDVTFDDSSIVRVLSPAKHQT